MFSAQCVEVAIPDRQKQKLVVEKVERPKARDPGKKSRDDIFGARALLHIVPRNKPKQLTMPAEHEEEQGDERVLGNTVGSSLGAMYAASKFLARASRIRRNNRYVCTFPDVSGRDHHLDYLYRAGRVVCPAR